MRSWRDDLFEISIFWGPVVFEVLSILGILMVIRPFILASFCIAVLYAIIAGLAYWLAGRTGRYGEGVPLYFGLWICFPSLEIAGVALGVFILLAFLMIFGIVL